jgi:hypothetical protein
VRRTQLLQYFIDRGDDHVANDYLFCFAERFKYRYKGLGVVGAAHEGEEATQLLGED